MKIDFLQMESIFVVALNKRNKTNAFITRQNWLNKCR